MRLHRRQVVVVVACLVLVVLAAGIYLAFGRSSPTTSAATVAKAAGAAGCSNSGYYMSDQDGKDKQTIFNCTMHGSRRLCVTYHGGIASNSTVDVRFAFSNALGQNKPDCLSPSIDAILKKIANSVK